MGGEAGEAQVQQDERVRVERAGDDHVQRDPHPEEDERAEVERPRSYAVAPSEIGADDARLQLVGMLPDPSIGAGCLATRAGCSLVAF
jgi:hypothetical protein